jgi:hypothetical protein
LLCARRNFSLTDTRNRAWPAHCAEDARSRDRVSLHLKQIDALEAASADIDQQVEGDIAAFRAAVTQLSSIPGVKGLGAKVIVSGMAMTRTKCDFLLRVSVYRAIRSRSSRARRWRAFGIVTIANVGSVSALLGTRQVLRTIVASSSSSVRKLCPGVPSASRRVCAFVCAASERCADATGSRVALALYPRRQTAIRPTVAHVPFNSKGGFA